MPEPVLLLMDYQEALCRPEGVIGRTGLGAEVERRGVLDAARRTLVAFRERRWPVIFVRVAFDDCYQRLTSSSPRFAMFREHRLLLESDPACQICDEIAPRKGEAIVTKGCVNPFIGTMLPEKLVQLRPTELVLGGVATNHVVESTARYAADVGYSVVVLEDLCASFDADLHAFAIERVLPFYAELMTSDKYLQERR